MNREFLEALGVQEEAIEQVLQAHEYNQKAWQDRYAKALDDAEQARFDGVLSSAIAAAGGRNPKAIRALLDVQTLRASEDVGAAVENAVAELKNENGYLFRLAAVPYAPGTGTGNFTATEPLSLAGALHEKFQR